MFTRILVCSDGSEHSLDATLKAAELAKSQGAHLTVLHVCHVPTVTPPFTGAPTLAGPLLDKYIRDLHAAVLARTIPVIKALGVCIDVIEEVGSPIDVIARIANTQDFDLVVIGSRGVSLDKADKLGSVCHGVIHSVFCPVMIVR